MSKKNPYKVRFDQLSDGNPLGQKPTMDEKIKYHGIA